MPFADHIRVSAAFEAAGYFTSKTKFVVVDRAGQIRGYYDADSEGIANLEAAVESVRKERVPD